MTCLVMGTGDAARACSILHLRRVWRLTFLGCSMSVSSHIVPGVGIVCSGLNTVITK